MRKEIFAMDNFQAFCLVVFLLAVLYVFSTEPMAAAAGLKASTFVKPHVIWMLLL
jgi:hypothetical protein